MHKVLNYGSALQAYALQQKLLSLGYHNEIIDYVYPPKKRKKISIINIIKSIIIFLRNLMAGFPTKRKQKKFDVFYSTNFILSDRQVDESNIKEIPIYDMYITGSDQVWNPRFGGQDPNFLLSFAPDDKPKISYASSFATAKIPDNLRSQYKKYLYRYNFISVRETNSVKIVDDLIGKDACVCCDPTLLLNTDDWDKLSKQSKLNIKYKYVLVYPLTYMYNPYPKIYELVKSVQNILGCKAIYLSGRKEDMFQPNSKLIKSAGPEDYVYLIKHAEFVITTSFHGAAFSMIYNKPMFGIVDKTNKNDNRIQSLLESFEANDSIYDLKDDRVFTKEYLLSMTGKQSVGKHFIAKSEDYLVNSLNTYNI